MHFPKPIDVLPTTTRWLQNIRKNISNNIRKNILLIILLMVREIMLAADP